MAASRSPNGGSAVVLEVCQGRRFRGAVSEAVLLEARVNIAATFGDPELARFYQQFASLVPEMVAAPTQDRLSQCIPLTTEKDAHVLAAAIACEADWLLTLDRRHLLNERVLGAGLSLQVMTPGDFLQRIVGGR